MKIIKFFIIVSVVVGALLATSCKKAGEPVKLSYDFTIDVTDVTAVNALLSLSGSGDEPALVRYMAPVLESEVLQNVGSMDNEQSLKEYVSRNGSAIKLPYSGVLKDLNPETSYVVGVVAYDANMDAYSFETTTFTTKDMASMTDTSVGDPSDAGHLTENVLQ